MLASHTFGHGVELGRHRGDDVLRGFAVLPASGQFQDELAVSVLVRGVPVVQLFERLQLRMQEG